MNILKILDVECLARTWKRRLDAAILANSHVSRQNKNILCCLLCIYIYMIGCRIGVYIYIHTCVCVNIGSYQVCKARKMRLIETQPHPQNKLACCKCKNNSFLLPRSCLRYIADDTRQRRIRREDREVLDLIEPSQV